MLSKGLQGDRGGGGTSWLELDSEAEYVLGVAAGASGEGVVQRLEESCVTHLSCTCPASETHRLHPKERPVPWELWLFVNSEEELASANQKVGHACNAPGWRKSVVCQLQESCSCVVLQFEMNPL